MRSNPPQFDQVLIDNYETLEKHVDPKWLPLPILVASRAAQHVDMRRQHLKRAEDWAAHLRKQGNHLEADDYLERTKRHSEIEIAKMLKQRQWRQGFTEYGSGHYGSVYPTQTPGVVCKITTDASEAQFVINAISLNKWPGGIVKYYAILRFRGKSHKNRPMYILWRDEVSPPTLASAPEAHDRGKFIALLHVAKNVGAEIRMTIQRHATSGYALSHVHKRIATALDIANHSDVAERFQADFAWLESPSRTAGWIRTLNHQRPKLEDKLSALFYAFSNTCDNMHLSYGFLPGRALGFYKNHGMILADVHGNNVMRSGEDWVISDPGHMIELDNRFVGIHVPEI